jgi:hypothetical protein
VPFRRGADKLLAKHFIYLFLKGFLSSAERIETPCNKPETEDMFPLFMQAGNIVSSLANDWREPLARR